MASPPGGMMRIFISYSRRDGNAAAERLEMMLNAHGFDVWRDVRDIDPVQDFTANIERGIDGSAWIVVCITPDTLRANSFVRREIQYALIKQKPVIPLRFEKDITPHISIINNEWIDFFAGWDQAFARLNAILGGPVEDFRIRATSDDPFRTYVEQLYNRTVEYFKRAIIGSQPIELVSNPSPDAVTAPAFPTPLPRQVTPLDQLFHAQMIDEGLPESRTQDVQAFTRFADAFEHYGRQVLLLGEPGAGKTVTLMAYARDAAARRLDDRHAQVPLFGLIAMWNAQQQTPLDEWLANSYGDLLTLHEVKRVIQSGQALLLLDGLDELGSGQSSPEMAEHADPRRQFLNALGTILMISPQNHVIVTCRVKDYNEIGQKIALAGAVTLQPLTDEQMRTYLQAVPALWDALETDTDLRDVARTPLLMALFAEGYQENTADITQLRDLSRSPGELRDRIFERYMRQRYEREKRRVEQIGHVLPYTLEEIHGILGELAMSNARNAGRPGPLIPVKENVLEQHHFASVLDATDVPTFTDLVTRLHFLDHGEVDLKGTPTFRFVHLLLRDYLGFKFALSRLHDPDFFMRSIAADSLGQLGDPRAVPLLAAVLCQDNEFLPRRDAAYALGELGDPRALDALYTALVGDEKSQLSSTAAQAIGKISGPRAFELLVAALPNCDEQTRSSMAHAFIETGDSRAPDAVIALLHDLSANVRQNAAAALGRIGTPAALAALDAFRRGEIKPGSKHLWWQFWKH